MVEPTGTYIPANIARLGHHDRQARPPRQDTQSRNSSSLSITTLLGVQDPTALSSTSSSSSVPTSKLLSSSNSSTDNKLIHSTDVKNIQSTIEERKAHFRARHQIKQLCEPDMKFNDLIKSADTDPQSIESVDQTTHLQMDLHDLTTDLRSSIERPLYKQGKTTTEIQGQTNRLVEHFEELLNRPASLNTPDIEAAHTDLPITITPQTTDEIRMVIKQTESGKAAGPDNIPAEALDSDDNFFFEKKRQPNKFSIVGIINQLKLDHHGKLGSTGRGQRNIPLMRVVQSVRHTKRSGSSLIIRETWMVHRTNKDPVLRRHFWRLGTKSITMFYHEKTNRYFKVSCILIHYLIIYINIYIYLYNIFQNVMMITS
ncbi:unnamed protein product [Schistosoma margrebowiei]|uniref:Uncharacterized protein n=1 Tax=Schistosoma margrebowiei TaxID=48269 RepID=A0A183L8V9_9TREM|nr:unnamed protein product [Schistosoma margrebowiei]